MLDEYKLDGRVAIITGAGRGIGRSIAMTLAEAGADIVVADLVVSNVADQATDTADEVRKLGRRAIAVPTDVTKAAEVEALVKQAISEFGKVDVLINNAGINLIKPLVPLPAADTPNKAETLAGFFTPTSEQEWHRVMDINLTSVFLCCRAVGPHMMERRSGKIINLSSIAGVKGRLYETAYGASKAGIVIFTRSLALEWARYNINVNGIAPGFILTPMSRRVQQDEKLMARTVSKIPLRRGAQPREVGLLAAYLASDASSYMTGQIISFDGGQTI